MLARSDVIAFVGTANPAAALAFYGDVLGLRSLSEEPSALVFDANGTLLRVSKVRAVARADYTVLGWKVPDIATAIRALSARGVSFERFGLLPQDEAGVWTAPDGTKVAWFRDPDGNLLSVTEFPPPTGRL